MSNEIINGNDYSAEIEVLRGYIKDLKDGRIYELNPTNGVPECNTLADKMDGALNHLLTKIAKGEPGFRDDKIVF